MASSKDDGSTRQPTPGGAPDVPLGADERRRLAFDLRDKVWQTLVALEANLARLRATGVEQPIVRECEEVVASIRACMRSLDRE